MRVREACGRVVAVAASGGESMVAVEDRVCGGRANDGLSLFELVQTGTSGCQLEANRAQACRFNLGDRAGPEMFNCQSRRSWRHAQGPPVLYDAVAAGSLRL